MVGAKLLTSSFSALVSTKVLKALFSLVIAISLVIMCIKATNLLPVTKKKQISPEKELKLDIKTHIESIISKYLDEIQTFPEVLELELKKGESKFSNEEARKVALPLRKNKVLQVQTNSTKLIYLATKHFGEWNPQHYYFPHLGDKTFKRYACPVDSCTVTNDKNLLHDADAVLFHVRDFTIEMIPNHRKKDQIYILYSMEPPWLETLDFRRFNDFFNWTMSYRKDSDVIVRYGFIGKRPEHKKDLSKIKLREVILKKYFERKKKKAVWFVSNCCTDSNREEFVSQLRQYYEVDIFGGCGEELCRPAETKQCYRKVARKYMFYLSFENAICDNYVTEKLFNILGFDIIPVVMGGSDYESIAPPNSVIEATSYPSPKILADYMHFVSRNYTAYRSYFEWKKKYKSYLHPWMCELCEKLHFNTGFRTVQKLQNWWDEYNSCRRYTGQTFLVHKQHPMPCYKRKIGFN